MQSRCGDPFIVYALPRSRTTWLARLLGCEHESAITFRSIDEIGPFFANQRGTVETAAAAAWRLVRYLVPQIREAVIFRPIEEVVESCRGIDLSPLGLAYDFDKLARNLRYLERHLSDIARQPGVISLHSRDLDDEVAVRRLFAHLGRPFDEERWQHARTVNVQIGVVEHIAYYNAHRPEIEAFRRAVASEYRRLARARLLAKECA